MATRREFIRNSVFIAAATAASRTGLAQDVPAPVSHKPGTGLDAVNPEFSETLQAMLKAGAMPELSSATLPQMRVGMAAYTPPLLPAPEVMKRTIPGPKSSPDVTVYVTGAKSGASKPAVLHMHGGGYIAGSAQMNRPDMQELALKHDCVAVSVEYRLAPETPFPGSLEDNYAGLQWLYKNATELGVDRSRIAIKGESAGGGHAAALAIRARDIGEIPICLQVLVYPMLDDRTASTVPAPASVGKYVWTPANNRFGWTSLLGRPAGSSQAPPNSVPARVNDLTGLPPAWIGVGSIDLFAAEDLTYGRRLLEAGVSTEIQVVPGAFHGFDLIAPQAPLSIAFAQSWNTALARAFKQQV